MANNINTSSLSLRRRIPVWSSYEAPAPKKTRKINAWDTVTSNKWTTYVQPASTPTLPSVSTNVPPVGAKVYNLRNRTVVIEQPAVIINGETDVEIPEGPETAARTLSYVRKSERLDEEGVPSLSPSSSSAEIEVNLPAPPAINLPMDKEPVAEAQSDSSESSSCGIQQAPEPFLPPLDPELVYVPCSPEESLKALERCSNHSSARSLSSASSEIDSDWVPETPPQF